MPAEPAVLTPPTTVDPDAKAIGGMFDGAMRDALQKAMDAKGDVVKEATANPPPQQKPPDSTQPPAPDAQKPPLAPQKPAATTKPTLPNPDAYVPGSTHKADWDRIKAERDAARAEAAELKGKVGAASPEITKTLAELQKERDEYKAQLQSVAIERDPAFDKEFATATQTVLTLARNVAGDQAAKVEAILKMLPGGARDAAIGEVMEALPSYKQVMLGTALADMEKINLTRQSRIEESRQNWGRLQAEAVARQQATEVQHKATLEGVIAQWTDPTKGFPFLQRKSDDPAHNARVDGTIALARDIFAGDLDMEKMAKASMWAASAEHLLNTIANHEKENAALQARIEELTGVSPGAGDAGTGGTARETTEDDIPVGTTYGGAIAQMARKAGLR